MLRIAFLLLVLANAGYYLWGHGHLEALGLAPARQSEPERLNQQVRPEALGLLSVDNTPAASPGGEAPSTAPPAPTPASAPAQAGGQPTICLVATGIEDRHAEALRRGLVAQVASDQWDLSSTHQPGRWMVYMGKFPDAEFLERKRAELRARKIDFDRAGGALEPGLSLGRFSTEEAATRELTNFARQGVRTARVVQERPDVTLYTLRLPQATPALRSQVEAMGGKAFEGKPFKPC
ncbi:Uncharacterised protein [Delftia tsuruhatensis]|uniref:SPOR domain-containing protein n=1 Tax=Delftia tsuruhatensis TaxID=180282 RepID=UPI001E712311|nr:SPOR domain-containing protein [Delftia tsuruhatensis]CAB5723021.1 Uncharacterised protein [Delftia tsuruhatensis]CAC9693343.1 Uncharacterised protein [Delftia tsuruhatensis]